ncbi:MAG: transposase, partial [Halobacteriota archaeon]
MKLLPTEEQKQQLLRTMERFNEACEFVSAYAYEHRRFGKVFLQRDLYYEIRHRFGLSAQLTVRAVGKVSESYKRERTARHHFNRHSAVVYDERILTFKSLDCVSILTLEGRIKVPVVIGEYAQLERRRVRGQADLIYRHGTFYLCAVVDASEDTPITPKGCLGIDMGVTNIATTSDGVQYTSEQADTTRTRYQRLRSTLQHVGTKSAKRHLKRVSGRERRFKTSLNHVIAKRIVQTAKDTERAIAVEDLTHIRARTTV